MKITEDFSDYLYRQPWKIFFYILTGWILIGIFNFAIQKAGIYTNTPYLFPISIFKGPLLHLSGLIYLLIFVIFLFPAVRIAGKLSPWAIFLLGLLFIILGNLGQGGFDAGFLKPFYETGIQYYHDAIKITDWETWLAGFNNIQPELYDHSRTHPPFAILIHYFALKSSGGSISFLSMSFVLISWLSIPLLWLILREFGTGKTESNLLTLLYSLIPAVNIYSASSIDGLIMTSSTIFLLGIVLVLNREKKGVMGILLCITGFAITNFLSFGGIFLMAVGIVLGSREFFFKRKANVLIVTIFTGLSFLIMVFIIKYFYGYDHIKSFFTASHIENPDGFMAFAHPWEYVMTRLENACEIALFFSFGCLAVFINKNRLKYFAENLNKKNIFLMLSGVFVLFMMFLSGAFRTGETARACLFIYPYLFLGLIGLNEQRIRDIAFIAGLQTVAMQLFGGYFW